MQSTSASKVADNVSNTVSDYSFASRAIRVEELGASPVGGDLKRWLDIIIAIIAIFLLSPLLILVAATIWFTAGRPILFTQRRVGFGGSTFNCYKFRTMAVNSDELLHRHLAANAEAAEEWRRTQKLRNDPRIVPIGHFLRKSSIDELPQLFNVLRGEMSCVGPRPVVVDELQRYGEESLQYLRARPGITGAWQVAGRSELTYAERVKLDSSYIQNWSLFRDIIILIRTIPAILRFDRAS